jgi:WD40 repeat protein
MRIPWPVAAFRARTTMRFRLCCKSGLGLGSVAFTIAAVLTLAVATSSFADDAKPAVKAAPAQVSASKPSQAKAAQPPKAPEKPAAKPVASEPAAKTAATAKAAAKPVAPAPPVATVAKPAATKATAAPAVKPVSFIRDIAPIFVESCIACHNPRKAENKYVMTTFGQLAKGGKAGEGITLEPGKPDDSYLIEVIRPDAQPRMPYKQDPLSPAKISLIERWVKEGGKYDGASSTEDWTIVMRKAQQATIPSAYPATVPITALEFSRDGSRIAVSGFHEITFWKTADGTLSQRLTGLAERIYDIAYSPDGKWMITASGDPGIYGVAKLWQAEADGSAKPVREMVETQDVVFTTVFSPDSKKVAVGGADRTMRVFEVETGKSLAQVEDHADWLTALAFSPDGKRLATASRDKTTKVFDLEKKESLVTYPGHAQPVNTVAFTPDGKAVASGGDDNRVKIWNPDADGKLVRDVGGFGGAVFKLEFAPDGQTFAACGADKTIHIFKTQNGSEVRKLQGHNDWVYTLAFSRDGKTLASGSWDGEVRLWNVADGKLLRVIVAAPGYPPPGVAKQASSK